MIRRSTNDEAATARIQATNGLESYSYNFRKSLKDEKLKDKFNPADKSKLEDTINNTIKWLDASQEGSKAEYGEKQKKLGAIARPVMQKFYSDGGAPGGAPGDFRGGAPGGFPGGGDTDGPSVAETISRLQDMDTHATLKIS